MPAALYKATFGIPEERNKAIPAALLAVLSVQFVSGGEGLAERVGVGRDQRGCDM